MNVIEGNVGNGVGTGRSPTGAKQTSQSRRSAALLERVRGRYHLVSIRYP